MPNKMRECSTFNVDEFTRERDKDNHEDGKTEGLCVLMSKISLLSKVGSALIER